MRAFSIRPGGLSAMRLLQVLAALSVVFVAVLASAPVRPYFAEWRSVQKEYNRLAAASGASPTPIAVKQIWKPELGVTDRCTTCHLGMAGTAAPLSGHRLFGAHPVIPHEPREFGCTVCHGGQGRATSKEDAHGFVSHWDEQILDRQNLSAGCGTCHDQFPFASRTALDEGARLTEQLDCLSCHRLDARGRGDAPDLTYVGIRGYPADWYATHLAKHEENATDAWRSSFGPIVPADLTRIDAFLKTRVGAPAVVDAQAVAMSRGCLGCHKLNGVGGDEGPALDAVGRKPVGDLDFTRVPGPPTFTNYMRAHLIDPSRVFPGSTMLAQDYAADEIDLLTNWVLFLRSRDMPPSAMPKDRVRRTVLGEPRPALSGEENFGAFCSACHGRGGEGRSYGGSEARFPAIGSADFLDVASDAFITSTLTTGRPNRRMPALGAPGASLGAEDIAGLIAFLRGRRPPAPTLDDLRAQPQDPALGRQTYRDDCAGCHGESGEGTALGSPLAAADLPLTMERAYDATVRGVAGTAMPAYGSRPAGALAAVLRHIQELPRTEASRKNWTAGAGHTADAERGAELYSRACAGCHGANGEGKVGPALANPGFQKAASAEYVAATVARGRAGTPMPSFGRDNVAYQRLTAPEILDLTAFVRERLSAPPRAQGAQ
jgi:mono/diheme cytochrome c family protein